jgi:hypothetical protein
LLSATAFTLARPHWKGNAFRLPSTGWPTCSPGPGTRPPGPDQDATVDLSSLADTAESPAEMLADRDYGDIDLAKLTVGGYGYRWIRLC